VTAELLENIFYPKTPMHDGAVIIRNGRVEGAGCMLPMSGNNNLSRELGMRHRAGIGISEHSDAVVAIVSEETGSISVAMDGMLKRHLAPETMEKLLRNELLPPEQDNKAKLNLGSLGRIFLELIHAKKRSGDNVSKQ
jgi:diadenylate cyclase